LIAVALGGVTVDAALKKLIAPEFQQLAAGDLVEGDQPPPGVHPNAPDRALRFLSRSQRPFLRLQVSLSFYAIFV
jgi:hypothetical protein